MKNPFTNHPHSMGETYFQHLFYAVKFGTTMILGGIACIIHAIFPFLFKTTGSNLLIQMTYRFIDRSPVIEDRFIVLSESIDKKINSSFVS